MWSSDLGSSRTNSLASRWLIGVLPASLYKMNADGTNLTVLSVTRAITESFNKMAREGITVRDLKSRGGGVVAGVAL